MARPVNVQNHGNRCFDTCQDLMARIALSARKNSGRSVGQRADESALLRTANLEVCDFYNDFNLP